MDGAYQYNTEKPLSARLSPILSLNQHFYYLWLPEKVTIIFDIDVKVDHYAAGLGTPQ